MQVRLPFFTLLFLFPFASVNAVLFTPALPHITHTFNITQDAAQQTITWFLIGYTIGQLFYGPLANRFGRKKTLYAGIILQIFSSLVCVAAGLTHQYWLLVLARFFLALGSGVGLKMTFTLVNECYPPKESSAKLSYLMLAFAIAPGLAVALGGFLNTYFSWLSCFYASACYGILLLLLVKRLPETQARLEKDALKLNYLIPVYVKQFKNLRLISCGLLMGCSTCFVYVFAATAPFIAISLFGMKSAEYGMANLLPPIGLILGCTLAGRLAKVLSQVTLIKIGIVIISAGILLMVSLMLTHFPIIFSLFLPMIIIYLGSSLIPANASIIAMSQVSDKAHASSVINFINMGLATFVTLNLTFFPSRLLLLPGIYTILWLIQLTIFNSIIKDTPSFEHLSEELKTD